MDAESPPPDLAANPYVERVNLAIDFIVQNLEQKIRLEDVSRVACFSPFHFHRIFRTLVGETLKQFVRRLRLERALRLMEHGGDRPLTDIALASGFSSSSDFSRTFKQRYGVPPSAFDVETFRKANRALLSDAAAALGAAPTQRSTGPSGCGRGLGPERANARDASGASGVGGGAPAGLHSAGRGSASDPLRETARLPPGENPDGFEVTLRELPARTVAYIRVMDPFRDGPVLQATERLLAWADRRNIAHGQWLGYMWDDPEIVALADCRYDVGLEVEDVQPAGEIGRFEFPEMLVAQVPVRGAIDLEQRAIDWVWGTWLPQSAYVPTDHPSFEAWIGRPFAHGHEHFELHLQLPVVRG